jgi:hypothetical protein
MKIKMPKFPKLTDDDFDDEGCICIEAEHPYFYSLITVDGGYTRDDARYFLYGYISSEWSYDASIVVSDVIFLDETKDGQIKRSSVKKAYKTVVKQLKERYRQWVEDHILETKKKVED